MMPGSGAHVAGQVCGLAVRDRPVDRFDRVVDDVLRGVARIRFDFRKARLCSLKCGGSGVNVCIARTEVSAPRLCDLRLERAVIDRSLSATCDNQNRSR